VFIRGKKGFRVVRVFRGSIPGSLGGQEKAVPACLAFNYGEFARIKIGLGGGLSAESFHVQTTAFNDAFQSADGNGFAPMHGHDHLLAIFMTPFLVTSGLSHQRKAVLAQNFDDLFGVANWEPSAHGTASSINFAPLFILKGAGSNHSSNASFAFAMASASVSPAEAQPGSSGKTADQRFVSGSNSTSRRTFMAVR
jgi:hypothetical protein